MDSSTPPPIIAGMRLTKSKTGSMCQSGRRARSRQVGMPTSRRAMNVPTNPTKMSGEKSALFEASVPPAVVTSEPTVATALARAKREPARPSTLPRCGSLSRSPITPTAKNSGAISKRAGGWSPVARMAPDLAIQQAPPRAAAKPPKRGSTDPDGNRMASPPRK